MSNDFAAPVTIRYGDVRAHHERRKVHGNVPGEDVTIRFIFQHGVEVGVLRDEESGKLFEDEERGDVEGHGEEGRRHGRTAEAVDVRILLLGFVFVILVGQFWIDEGVVGEEETGGGAAFEAGGGIVWAAHGVALLCQWLVVAC